jgi:hypothetical protein
MLHLEIKSALLCPAEASSRFAPMEVPERKTCLPKTSPPPFSWPEIDRVLQLYRQMKNRVL